MKKAVAIFLSLALSGCASTNNLALSLPMLEGKPVSQAVQYLGYPAEEKKILGKTVYSWINYQSGSFFIPDSGVYPSVSNEQGRPVVVFSSAMPRVEEAYHWHCRLDVITDRGVIVETQYQGGGNACQLFSDQLKPLIDKK